MQDSNKGKTVAFLTNGQNSDIYQDVNLGIEWITKSFKTLGTWFSIDPEEATRPNFNVQMTIIRNTLKHWGSRSLTLKGKIVVLKALIVPHLIQLASSISFS